MSTVMVVAPIVIANWPAITAAVTAAISVTGFTVAQQVTDDIATSVRTQTKARNRETIDVDNSEILQNSAATGQQIVVQRDGVVATFTRDSRGALKLCIEGDHLSKSELRAIGEELVGRVTQAYAYNRIVSELANRGMTVVSEENTENQSVKLRVRNY